MEKTDNNKSAPLSFADEALFARAICELIGISILNLVEKMKPPSVPTERAKAALFLNIAESFNAANVLVRQDLSIHAGLHIRAMLESYVHLTMLGEDAKYLDQMTFDQVDGELKLRKALLKDVYISESSKELLVEQIQKLQGRRDVLFAAGCRSKNLTDLINVKGAAHLSHLFTGYLALNTMAHWDLAMLSDRHMKEDGGMKIFAKSTDSVTIGILFTAMKVMVSATAAIEKVTQFADGAFEKEFEHMNNAWGRYLDLQGQKSDQHLN